MGDGISMQTKAALLRAQNEEMGIPNQVGVHIPNQVGASIPNHQSVGKMTAADRALMPKGQTKQQISDLKLGKKKRGVYGD